MKLIKWKDCVIGISWRTHVYIWASLTNRANRKAREKR